MMQNVVPFLRRAFPFLITIVLWRLALPIWNPSGVLALIPIFFCTFVRPTPWFALFGLLFCFLLDYKFAVPFVWTALWCVFYAVNGFQTVIDLARMAFYALYAFMAFFGLGVLIILALNPSWPALIRAVFTIIWVGALYVPMVALIKRIDDD